MNDSKLHKKRKKKRKKEVNYLIKTIMIYSRAVGMEFGIEKCAMLILKSRKRKITEGIELPNQDKIWTLEEKETYKYLGTLEADTIKEVEMKEK